MHVRLYRGVLYSVDASITNDWVTLGAQDLDTGSELTGDTIDGDVTIESAVLLAPRSES
jgi:hypothetical protein